MQGTLFLAVWLDCMSCRPTNQGCSQHGSGKQPLPRHHHSKQDQSWSPQRAALVQDSLSQPGAVRALPPHLRSGHVAVKRELKFPEGLAVLY